MFKLELKNSEAEELHAEPERKEKGNSKDVCLSRRDSAAVP